MHALLEIQSSPARKSVASMEQGLGSWRKCQWSLVETFDGDEMNGHAPQSLGARAENSVILSVPQAVVSRQGCAPVMGSVQNTLIAHYVLTNWFTPMASTLCPEKETAEGDTLVGLGTFMNLVMEARIDTERFFDLAERSIGMYPAYVYRDVNGKGRFRDYIPGKIVSSIVFPENLCYHRKTETNEKYPEFRVVNGVIVPESGPICKKIIGGGAGTVTHVMWKYFSPQRCCDMLSELGSIANIYLPYHGFSMGISDCLPTSRDEVEKALAEASLKCEMEANSNKDPAEKETAINGILNQVMGVVPLMSKKGMNKGDRNNLIIMKKCGAKGSDVNKGRSRYFLGQQNVDAKRMPLTLSGYS